MAGAKELNKRAIRSINDGDYTTFISQVMNGIYYPHFLKFLSDTKPVGILADDAKSFHLLADKGKLSLLVNLLLDDEKWVRVYKQEFGVTTNKKNLSHKLKLLSGIIEKDDEGKTTLQKSIEQGDAFDLMQVFEIFLRTDNFKIVYESIFEGLEAFITKASEEKYSQSAKKIFNQMFGFIQDKQKWPAIYSRTEGEGPKKTSDKDELLKPFLKKLDNGHTILSKAIEAGIFMGLNATVNAFSYDKQSEIIEAIWKGVSSRAEKLASQHNKTTSEILNDSQFKELRAEFTKVVEANHTYFIDDESVGAFQRLITFATCHSNKFWGMNTDSFLEAFNIKTFVVNGQTIGKRDLQSALFNASNFSSKEITLEGGTKTSLDQLEGEAKKKLQEFRAKKYILKSSGKEFSINILEEECRSMASDADELDRLFSQEHETADGKKLSLEKLSKEYDELSNKLMRGTKHDILGEEEPLSISDLKARESFIKSEANGYFRDMMIDLLVRKSIEKGPGNIKITDLLPELENMQEDAAKALALNSSKEDFDGIKEFWESKGDKPQNIEDITLSSNLTLFVILGLFEERENGPSPTERGVHKVTFADQEESQEARADGETDLGVAVAAARYEAEKENAIRHNPPSDSLNAKLTKKLPLLNPDAKILSREMISLVLEQTSARGVIEKKFGKGFISSLMKFKENGTGDEYAAAAIVFLASINEYYLAGRKGVPGKKDVESHIDQATKILNMKHITKKDFIESYIATWDPSWASANFGKGDNIINLWDIISSKAKTPDLLEALYEWYLEQGVFTAETAHPLLKTPCHTGCKVALKFIKDKGICADNFWDNVFLEFVRSPRKEVMDLYLEDGDVVVSSTSNREKVLSEDSKYIFVAHAQVTIGDILADIQTHSKTGDSKQLTQSRKDLNTILDFLILLYDKEKLYLPEYNEANKEIVKNLLKWVGAVDDMIKHAQAIFEKIEGFKNEDAEWSKIIKVNGAIVEYYKEVPTNEIDFDQRTLLSYISYQFYKKLPSENEGDSAGTISQPSEPYLSHSGKVDVSATGQPGMNETDDSL